MKQSIRNFILEINNEVIIQELLKLYYTSL